MLGRLRCLAIAAALTSALIAPVLAGDFDDGLAAFGNRDYRTAFRLWKHGAEGGDASSQFQLGQVYLDGYGVAPDSAAAVVWFRKAAEQGLPGAEHVLAFMYYLGQGVDQNTPEAEKWFRKAAERGTAPSQ